MAARPGLYVLAALIAVACTVSAFAEQCPRRVGWWPYGPVVDVAIAGEHAVFGSGRTLFIADISSPETPRIVGELALPRFIGSVTIDGDYAYVGSDVLRVIDISVPERPLEVGSADAGVTDLVVMGDIAYGIRAEAWFGYLVIFDISDPTAPRTIEERMANCVAITRHSHYLFLATSYAVEYGTLRVLDISEPANPIEVALVEYSGFPNDLEVFDDFLAVTDIQPGLRIFDIGDPTAPREVASLVVPAATQVTVSGGVAFVGGEGSVLRLIDVSDPARPVVMGSADLSRDPQFGCSVGRIAVSDSTALVVGPDNGVAVVDVSIPHEPTHLVTVPAPGWVAGVTVSGGKAFATEHAGGRTLIRILDLSTARVPTEVGSMLLPEGCSAFDIAGDLAYVGCYDELVVYDISDLANPSLLASIETTASACSVEVVDGFAYLGGCYFSGLAVVDVSRPDRPAQVGLVDTPYASDMTIAGDLALVASGYHGLRVIDVSVPSDPVEICRVGFGGSYVGDVAVAGDLALVARGRYGVSVIDISRPGESQLVGGFVTGSSVQNVAASRRLAYITDFTSGLMVYDISDPTWPVQFAIDDSLFGAGEIELTPRRAYVVGQSGFDIYDITTCSGGEGQIPDPRRSKQTGH
jgi:hypothetical protein